MATQGTSYNLLNYIGEVMTASKKETPIFSIASLNGIKSIQNDVFPLSVEYALPAAAQTIRTEV